MTKDEAMKLALRSIRELVLDESDDAPALQGVRMRKQKAEKALREALAQPEQDNTYIYASSLATAIWQKHYMKESPKFALLDTTEGVLTQIDNMTCGLVREKPAQPEQEPVAWVCYGSSDSEMHDVDFEQIDVDALPVGTMLYATPPQRKPLTDEEIKALFEDGLAFEHDTTIVREIEAAHGIKE